MGLLKRFFSSPEILARELVADDTKLIVIWQEYVASTREKGMLIEALKPGTSFQDVLRRLKNILTVELVKAAKEQKTEKELIADLQALMHEEHVKRVKRLEYTMGYALTKYEYIRQLLNELWDVLANEIAIVNQLLGGSEKKQFFIKKLNELWHVEQHILAQINERETFHQLFSDLLKGERIIARLTARQKRAIPKLQPKMFARQGIHRAWLNAVFVGITDAVTQALARGELGNHNASDFEFVNSPAFVDLVRAIARSHEDVQNIKASEDTILVFVKLFRDWYNTTLKL